MSKARILSLVIVAFIGGVIFGGWGASRFWEHFTGDLSNSLMAAEIGKTVRTLESLRSGKTSGAINLLESDLDGALIGLGTSISPIPKSSRDATCVKAVQLAKDYRANYPRTNNVQEITSAIDKTFRLVDSK